MALRDSRDCPEASRTGKSETNLVPQTYVTSHIGGFVGVALLGVVVLAPGTVLQHRLLVADVFILRPAPLRICVGDIR